jgi:small GTP-binding protein
VTVDESNDTRLATRYETIRRREYELITELLELLPKIDTLEEDRVVQVRDALFHADHPFLMVFVGPFSSGKSSLINALLGDDDLLAVGPVPTTDRISILRWGDEPQRMDSAGEVETVFYPSPLLQKVSFVDTPGLESIFQKHEQTTSRFLHRSDVVILVMSATHALSHRTIEYLQRLREYGKKVIVLINQTDLISDEDAETVREYVQEQSHDRLNFKPEVWLVSARKGMQSRANGELDDALWQQSGLHQIEQYVDRELGDVERMRQKLQTPLQISQNVHRVALEAVKENQKVLDQYQGIAENVQQQLAAYRREQEKIVREINEEISEKFGAAALRGSEAIREIFQLSRAVASVWRGFMDVTGLAQLFRRGEGRSYIRLAFERHQVYEPVAQLPEIVDKLGPRLEGKDLHDLDDLVKYAQKEIKALPPAIRGKIIGGVHAPVTYDRAALQEIRPELEQIETEARIEETEKLETNLRNVLFALALWELLAIFVIAVIVLGGVVTFAEPMSFAILLVMMLLGMMGLLLLPVVGRVLEVGHTNRMLKLQARYIETLTRAADKQIEYGMSLRQEVVAPLTRLVEAQTQLQTEQMNKLQSLEQEMINIESELTRLGKRNLFGLRG